MSEAGFSHRKQVVGDSLPTYCSSTAWRETLCAVSALFKRYGLSQVRQQSDPDVRGEVASTAVFEIKGKISVDTAPGRFIIILVR
jgi:hypothetical protein